MIMCKIDDYIRKTKDYIDLILHEKASLSPVDSGLQNSIPMAFMQSPVLFNGSLLGHPGI